MERVCPNDKILNVLPKPNYPNGTGRCVKREGVLGLRVIAYLAANDPARLARLLGVPPIGGVGGMCPPDSVWNPQSLQCVKRNGVKGRQIINGTAGFPQPQPGQDLRVATCPADSIWNGATNRCVKRTSATGRRILAAAAPAAAAPAVILAPAVIPAGDAEGYLPIGTGHMTVDEFIDECIQYNEVPIILRIGDNLLFYTTEELQQILDNNGQRQYYECRLLVAGGGSDWAKWNRANTSRRPGVINREVIYNRLEDLAHFGNTGLLEVTSVVNLSQRNQLTYVEAVQGRRLTSYTAVNAMDSGHSPNCKALGTDTYIYDLQVLN